MQLTVLIIIGNLTFKVTHIEALNECDSYRWHGFEFGQKFLSQVLCAVSEENCFTFKSYNQKENKVVLNYNAREPYDVNKILSKCTCVAVN